MFSPRYDITNHLLWQITRINRLVSELNNRRFPSVVLAAFKKTAASVSAHASTSIEGNPLPLTEVRKLLKSTPTHIGDSEREVINYNHALQELNRRLDEGTMSLSLDHILRIHKHVTDGLMPEHESGAFRQRPVMINDPRSHTVVFLPPDANEVNPLMTDLIEFVHKGRDHIDPLILAGIFHKQMVLIHPFMDGNGRTTRLATKVLLAHMGLNTFHLFSFENYYNQNVSRYFQTVGEFGDYYERKERIDFTVWLEYFTEGIIDELLRVGKLLPQTETSPQTQLRVHEVKLLKHIRENGFITDRIYRTLVDRAKATRTGDFKRLRKIGLIEAKDKGKATYYVLSS